MDRQEQELRRQTAGTGVEIERNGDELVLKPDGTDDLRGRRKKRDDAHINEAGIPAPSMAN